MHAPELPLPVVTDRLCHHEDLAEVGDKLALRDQMLRDFQRADDLLCYVTGAFHGGDQTSD
jgi:hypothetical protein